MGADPLRHDTCKVVLSGRMNLMGWRAGSREGEWR